LGQRGRPKKGEEKGGNATLKPNQKNTKAHILLRLDRDGFTETENFISRVFEICGR
jgi:hypothetical protein